MVQEASNDGNFDQYVNNGVFNQLNLSSVRTRCSVLLYLELPQENKMNKNFLSIKGGDPLHSTPSTEVVES